MHGVRTLAYPWSKPEGLEGRLSSWSEATKSIGTRFNEYLI